MRWNQLLALVVYVALVVPVWVNAGVAAGLLFVACALLLTVCVRQNEAGDAVRAWAGLLYGRRALWSSQGVAGTIWSRLAVASGAWWHQAAVVASAKRVGRTVLESSDDVEPDPGLREPEVVETALQDDPFAERWLD